jgi:hypothetical protein
VSNIVPSYERFESDGLELVVNTSTGLAYASIRATARMLETDESNLRKYIKKGEVNYGLINAEFPTSGGLQGGVLIPSQTIFELALNYNIPLAKKMGAAGANLYMLGLAGYKTKILEADVEQDRAELERKFLPTPPIKQLKEVYSIQKMMHKKPYADRWMAQMLSRHYPALVGDAPQPEELASLPTARALLTPTQLAEELGWKYKTGRGNAQQVNTMLLRLGYQEVIADRWSATAKAIAANLVDRKPVETNSRTQKDQLLWSADMISILQEHSAVP